MTKKCDSAEIVHKKVKQKFRCLIHGEIEHEFKTDFIGDKHAVTIYCPKCEEEARHAN